VPARQLTDWFLPSFCLAAAALMPKAIDMTASGQNRSFGEARPMSRLPP
jgi:hypothetical protein